MEGSYSSARNSLYILHPQPTEQTCVCVYIILDLGSGIYRNFNYTLSSVATIKYICLIIVQVFEITKTTRHHIHTGVHFESEIHKESAAIQIVLPLSLLENNDLILLFSLQNL